MEHIDSLSAQVKAAERKHLQVVRIGIALLIMAIPSRFYLKAERAARPVGGVRAQIAPFAKVQQWTKPQSGWLYVVDSNGMSDTSQILLVNPMQRAVAGVVRAAYVPDVALSPDGARLYLASGAPGSISVINTGTGSVEGQFSARDRLVQLGATVPSMTVAPNNRWLFIEEFDGATAPSTYYGVASFDTTNNGSLISRVPIPNCGVGRFGWISQNKLLVHCHEGGTINVLTIDTGGQVIASSRLTLPMAPRPPGLSGVALPIRAGRAVGVSILPDNQTAVVFTRFGAVSGLDLLTQLTLPKTAELTTGARWSLFEDWPRSSDGKKYT